MSAREFENKHPASEELHTIISPEVFILAGGKGTRLKRTDDPELLSKPKPLVTVQSNVGELPMLDYVILNLEQNGFNNLTFLTSDDPEAQGNDIEHYVSECYGRLNPSFSREKSPLGTAGAAFLAMQNRFTETSVITPADTFFPFEMLPLALDTHIANKNQITWLVTTEPGEGAQNTGRILVEGNSGVIYQSLEGSDIDSSTICLDGFVPSTSVGVVVTDRKFYVDKYNEYIAESTPNGPVDLYRNFIPWLIENGTAVHTFDIKKPAPDLGTPERLFKFGRGN
ncbi:NTP transferase domain-containing protein [Patescibacteria group bacterium]|nr:NTP transferase domain-containing protein [Patescibacteria group bacterium]